MSPKTPAIWKASPDDVRSLFLDYFRRQGHEVHPSASLVPENDPSLLFIGAGMAPFKDRFLGRVPLTFRRAATSQKCLRTGDLENVGRTPGHHTFFEMLGNFSFGDSVSGGYGKAEAIAWAWELLTSEKWLAIPEERLRVSVYKDDEEAARIWKKVAGLGDDRIARLGAKSNFWPANAPEDGPDGPCGPCSEIFFDLGFVPSPVGQPVPCMPGLDCANDPRPESVDCSCNRFIEIWNLVFQQYDRKGANNLIPLPMRNIDTGAGFERFNMVLAHLAEPDRRIYSNFDTPLFRPLVEHVPPDNASEVVLARRVADHVRAAVFCVADGVRPSNDGRGFVLRRLIRRAARDLWTLSRDQVQLAEYVELVCAVMGSAYPTIRDGSAIGQIEQVVSTEEERFRETYSEGAARLGQLLKELKLKGGNVLPGTSAFLLHDTFGFPVDVTIDILHEQGLGLDVAGFEREMEAARQRSRDGSKMAVDIFAAGPLERVKRTSPGTVFLGYGPEPEGSGGSYSWHPGVEGESVVVELIRADRPVDRMEPGEEGAVLLRETPFYAEQGGQVGDTGVIRGPGKAVFRVRDTQKVEGFHLHLGTLEGGPLSVGDRASAVVDRERRDAIRRNHTGTHLLHKVLKVVLGEDARQAGSLVAPDRLRFDFSWPRPLSPEERGRVEAEVNRRIGEARPLVTRVFDPAAAKATGAVSMFGEKYGDRIRVLTAGDSMEYCGGTHCRSTGDIEEFRIVAEKSIGSGVRRIEAVTGREAVRALEEERRRAAEEERRREEERRARKAAGTATPAVVLDPLAAPRRKAGLVEYTLVDGEDLPEAALLGAGDRVKADDGAPLAVLVSSRTAEGVALVAAGNPAAVKAGFKAGAAIKAAAEALGGGGGGRPDLARGKGKDAARLPDAVKAFEAYLAALGG